jgi:hypothetical protein
MANSVSVEVIEEALSILDDKLGCITILEEWTSLLDGWRESVEEEE